MRFCGTFRASEKLSCPKEWPKPDCVPRECVRTALLTIDHTDRGVDDKAGSAQRLDRVEQSSTGCYDVLDQANALALLVGALTA